MRRLPVLGSFSRVLLGNSLLLALCCLAPADAWADEPGELSSSGSVSAPPRSGNELSYSGSAGAFYGGLPDASDSLNPYGVGLGLRLGITLPQQIYLGVSYEHFFGGEGGSYADIAAYEKDATLDQLAAWVGYELPLDGVTLRPCLGLGAAYMQEETLTTDARGQERSEDSALGFVVSPALQLQFPVGPASILIEGRYTIVPEAVAEADAVLIGVGFGAEI